MKLLKFLKPSKWKLILSLIPFLFLSLYLIRDLAYLLPIHFDDVLMLIIIAGTIIEVALIAPFEPLLRSLNLWSEMSPLPSASGAMFVYNIYAVLIYLFISWGQSMEAKRKAVVNIKE